MRKSIILLIVVLLLITSCNSESIIEEPTKPSEVNAFDETIADDHIKIDDKMYPIDEMYEEVFDYEDDSDLLERKLVSYNNDERTSDYVRSYEYTDGLVVKEVFDRIEKTTFRYDEDQHLIKTETYDSEDALIQTTNITYENEYIRKAISKKNGEVLKKSFEEKNNMGDVLRLMTISNLNEDEPYTMFNLIDNVYDESIRLIEKIQYKVINQIDAKILETNYFK